MLIWTQRYINITCHRNSENMERAKKIEFFWLHGPWKIISEIQSGEEAVVEWGIYRFASNPWQQYYWVNVVAIGAPSFFFQNCIVIGVTGIVISSTHFWWPLENFLLYRLFCFSVANSFSHWYFAILNTATEIIVPEWTQCCAKFYFSRYKCLISNDVFVVFVHFSYTFLTFIASLMSNYDLFFSIFMFDLEH